MYERLNRNTETAMAYRISSPLAEDEIAQIIDEIEGVIDTAGKVRILIDLQSFPYTDLQVLWEDLKFDVRHGKDIERLAFVGGNKIEQWSVKIFSLLSLTKCRCFKEGEVDQAWDWLVEE